MTRTGVATLLLALVLAAPAALAAPGGRALSPAVATAAFGRLLHQVYGPFHGYLTCPAKLSFGGNDDCLGEVEAGGRWHMYGARARRYHGIVDFHLPYAVTWARRWSPFSRHYILRSGEGQVPGVVSVNSPAYDWGWLAGCARGVKSDRAVSCNAYDGDDAGLTRFYIFACTRSGSVVTCRNALGDAMRYRPRR